MNGDQKGMNGLEGLAAKLASKLASGGPPEPEAPLARSVDVEYAEGGRARTKQVVDPELAKGMAPSLEGHIAAWQGEAAGIDPGMSGGLAQEHDQMLAAAGCTSPVEELLVRQMLTNQGMLRRLQAEMSRAGGSKEVAQLAELSLRAMGMGAKQALAWSKLRQPAFVNAPGGQVNVSSGAQQIVNQASAGSEERTLSHEPGLDA